MTEERTTGTSGSTVDRRIGALAGKQHGVVSRRQLRDLGISEQRIVGRVERRQLIPVHRGVYAVGHRKLTAEGRWMAAVLASGVGAVLSHRSAGQLWGIVPRSASYPEVTRPAGFRPRHGIRAHLGDLPGDETEVVEGIPATAIWRTLLDLAWLLATDEDATAAVRTLERARNEAESRGLTGVRSLPDLLERYPRRRGNGLLRQLLAKGAAAGVTKGELEERFLALLDRERIPRPRLNADLDLGGGRFIEIDCLWAAGRVAVELDSRAFHDRSLTFESDRARDRRLTARGWKPLRVTWAQLQSEPDAVISDLRRSLAL